MFIAARLKYFLYLHKMVSGKLTELHTHTHVYIQYIIHWNEGKKKVDTTISGIESVSQPKIHLDKKAQHFMFEWLLGRKNVLHSTNELPFSYSFTFASLFR